MAKVKVRVLYPSAFAAIGVDTTGKDEVSIEEAEAEQLVAVGYAELVKASKVKTETATVKLKDES